jgi:hypothetical protein
LVWGDPARHAPIHLNTMPNHFAMNLWRAAARAANDAERAMKSTGSISAADDQILRQLRHAEQVLLDYALAVMAREREYEEGPDPAPAQPQPDETAPPMDWFSSLPPGRVLRKLWSNSS